MARNHLYVVFCLLLLASLVSSVIDYEPFPGPNPDSAGIANAGAQLGDNITDDLDGPQDVSKRWYSFPPGPAVAGQLGRYSWPPSCGDPSHPQTWIRFCFTDWESVEALARKVVPRAIAMWAPTEASSSMRFQPDIGCAGAYECLCVHTGPDGKTRYAAADTL